MQLSHRFGRRLKLQNLHVLMAVVQAGSMRRAAVQLNTTQPSVSRAISELERALGVPLLDRTPQGIEPTTYGRALVDGGAAMFDELHQAVKNIEFLADPSAGEVRLGSVPAFAASFVTAVLNRLSQKRPRIRFHFVAGLVEVLHRELIDRNIDLAISTRLGPLTDTRLNFELLFDSSFVVAAGTHSPWVRRRKVDLAELADEPWALPSPESSIGSLFLQAFRESGLPPPSPTVTVDSVDARISLLASGPFLTIFDMTVLRFPSPHERIAVVPISLPIVAPPIGISTLVNRTLNPATRLFIACAHEVAKPLTKKNSARRRTPAA